MKIPLPASIKGLVTLIVLLAMLPALGLIVYSGYKKAATDLNSANTAALRSAKAIMMQQAQLVENTRILLFTLSQIKEVQAKDVQGCTELFRHILYQAPIYTNIRLIDITGNVIASADPSDTGLTNEERQEFIHSLYSSGFTVQELPRGHGQAVPVLNCQYPVRQHNLTPAVLVATLRLVVPPSDLKALAGKHVEHLYILDRSGSIVFAYPQQAYTLSLDELNLEKVWSLIRSSPESSGYLETDTGKYVVFEKMERQSSIMPDLSIMLTIADKTLYAQVRQKIATNTVTLLGALLIALLITLQLSNATLITPTRMLLRAAKRIKEGDLDTRVGDARMPLELKNLALSMDSMAGSINSRDKELMGARDAANAGNKAKSDFLANMSHEIRTPMNAILGMTYLTRQGDLTEQQRTYMDNIHNEADKLLVIINDILDFSKIEAGKFHIERVPFPLPTVIDEALDAARAEAALKWLSIHAPPNPGMPAYVFGDPLHLRQVLSNILSNAVKVAIKGSITMDTTVEHASSDSVVVEFRFSDSLGGMDADELAHLFPEVDDTTGADQSDGFRLNLAVTRNLTRLMDGELTVRTDPGLGSGIILRLPFSLASEIDLATNSDEAANSSQDRHPARASHSLEQSNSPSPIEDTDADRVSETFEGPGSTDSEPESLSGLRILLVEDNLVNQQIAQEILGGFGATVHTANNGLEALSMLDEMPTIAPYALVLMDLQMPELDGIAATRRIRLDGRFKNLPIIAMTAHTRDEEWAECKRAGMDGFVSKPIDVSQLLSEIRKWALPAGSGPRAQAP